ncbi:MAG TPA: 2-C-methyl-D-erythritol 4-phosphate cytidylyltransferase [Candidatus Nanopelagicaceae bacterium]|jgi:2-C-methyl-D-erythritol 4-phosphate cytidylyltransferase
MRFHQVLAVTSPSAFLPINETASLVAALQVMNTLEVDSEIVIAVNEQLATEVRRIVNTNEYSLLICEPTVPRSFAQALTPVFGEYDAIMIHDASRPMTPLSQFSAVITAFGDESDAVRPAMAFTETLKIVGNDAVIVETLDRTSVMRIGTPELIRVSAIDVNGQDCGWFLPLKRNARLHQIEGSPEGSRINTPADRDLMELHSN